MRAIALKWQNGLSAYTICSDKCKQFRNAELQYDGPVFIIVFAHIIFAEFYPSVAFQKPSSLRTFCWTIRLPLAFQSCIYRVKGLSIAKARCHSSCWSLSCCRNCTTLSRNSFREFRRVDTSWPVLNSDKFRLRIPDFHGNCVGTTCRLLFTAHSYSANKSKILNLNSARSFAYALCTI